MIECLFLGGLFLLLAAHPFTLYPLSLTAFARHQPGPARVFAARPTVAICMSAFNEEKTIVEKVESLLAMASSYGPATVNIYVDGATDRTVELLQPYASAVNLVVGEGRRGKTAGMNLLVAASQSDFICFTDANVQAPLDAIDKLIAVFEDSSVGCASACLTHSNPFETSTSRSGATYWNIEETIKRLESETIGLVGVDGAMFMVDRTLFQPPPDDLIDDLYVSLSILAAGRHVVSVPNLYVQEKSASFWLDEFHRKARIASQVVHVHRSLWPRLRALPARQLYGYTSHRLLKWSAPFCFALSAIFFIVLGCLQFGLLQVSALLLGGLAVLLLGALLGIRPLRLVLTSLVLLAGVGMGVLQGILFRRKSEVWTPAKSGR